MMRLSGLSLLLVFLGTVSSFSLVPQEQPPCRRLQYSSSLSSSSSSSSSFWDDSDDDDKDNNNNDDDDDSAFMKSLQARIDRTNNQMPLIFRDTLLPRQVLQMTVKRGIVLDLVKSRIRDETPYFGMVGIRPRRSFNTDNNADDDDDDCDCLYLARGVQVEVIGFEMNEWKTGIRLTLKAGKRFVIKDLIDRGSRCDEETWAEARVEFLDSKKQEAEEADVMSMALAMQQAREFTEPDTAGANESRSLVDVWLELARAREQYEGQIDRLLKDLGDAPSWKEPSECAFWVGALINPAPALGLAADVRQELLLADTAQERTRIALDAIWNSIQRMDPSPRFRAWHAGDGPPR